MTSCKQRTARTLRLSAAIVVATVGFAPSFAQTSPATPPANATATATAPATAPTVTAGQAVVDASGATVGTVDSVKGTDAIVKTDKYQLAIPLSSFAQSNGKLAIGSTQAQLNADYEKALAAAQAALVVGAGVNGSDGAPVGTISAIDSKSATIKLASGASVRVERAAIAADAKGGIIGATAADLEKQAAPAKVKKTVKKK